MELPFEPEIESDPFAEIAKTLATVAEMEAALGKDMTPDQSPEVLLDLADAKAAMMGHRQLLLQDWNWQFTQSYPASN